MSETLSQDELAALIVTLWAIWSARRKLIHEGIYHTPYAKHCFITSYISDLQFLKKPASSVAQTTAPRPTSWIPPQEDHTKINVDVAVSRAGGFGAVAAICRDLSGAYLGASALVFRNIDVAEVLETLAITEALALSDDLYLHKIAIASDWWLWMLSRSALRHHMER